MGASWVLCRRANACAVEREMILFLADLVPIEITTTSIKFTRRDTLKLFIYENGVDGEPFPGRVELTFVKDFLCVWAEPDLV